MKEEQCQQHKNPAQLICLHEQCTSRLMCMICQHNHELYTSIRAKSFVSLKIFKKKVEQSIDKSIKIIDNLEKGGIEREKKMISQYYTNVKDSLNKFLDLRMNQNLGLLNISKNSNLQHLIRSRIQGRYHTLSKEHFNKIKQVYEGKDLQTISRQQQQQSLQNAYNYMKQFHEQCINLFSKFKIQLKTKIPQIRIQSNSEVHKIHLQHDGQQNYSNKLTNKIKYTTNVEIQSVLSDAYSGNKCILTTSLDKTLRVWDKTLKIITSKQYNNILTRVQRIDEDIYAMGVSKQLHIIKISHEDGYDPKQILVLKGHTQRIWDIHSYNTRIVGSCSEEGVKIWDLYKEKCQYTLKDQINPSCFRFMANINKLAAGYHSHELKIYQITTMKPYRNYALPGVPLNMSQQNRNQNLLYCGGFDSNLLLIDVRLSKQVFNHNFKSQAVTAFKESLFQQQTLLLGERGGKVRIFDLRKLKTKLQWVAHNKITNLSRPNGVVRVYEQGINQILTVGSNDRKAIIWEITKGE